MKKWICFMIILSAALYTHAQEDSLLVQYKGVYKFPEGSVVPSVEITIENGALLASSIMGAAPLEKVSRDTFSIPTYSGMVYFIRTAEQKVIAIKIEVQDMVLEGKKENSGIVRYRHFSMLIDRKILLATP